MTENLPQKQVQGRFQEVICNKRSYNKLEKANKLITTYHDEINKKNILRLRELLNTLPSFVANILEGFRNIHQAEQELHTAYDIRIFLNIFMTVTLFLRKLPLESINLNP